MCVPHSALEVLCTVQLQSEFPGNTAIGRICMRQPLATDTENNTLQNRLLGFAFPAVYLVSHDPYRRNSSVLPQVWVFGVWRRKIRSYVRGVCLARTTFSSLGGTYRRNVFNYDEVSCALFCLSIMVLSRRPALTVRPGQCSSYWRTFCCSR